MKAILPLLLLALTATANAQISMGINRVVYVAANRDDAEASCAGLRSVLDSIEGPFAFYRVILEPGPYVCGVDTLVVPDHTVLEGSGHLSTAIFGNTGTTTGVITLGDSSVLRNLQVVNTGGGTVANAISTGLGSLGASTEITGVLAYSGSGPGSVALHVGPNTADLRVRGSTMVGEDAGAIIRATGFVQFISTGFFGDLAVAVIAGNPNCIHSWSIFDLDFDCSTPVARPEGQEAQPPHRRPPRPSITSYPEREKQ